MDGNKPLEMPPLVEELLPVGGCCWTQSHSSLGVWALAGCQCPNRCPHTFSRTNQTQKFLNNNSKNT